MKHIFTLILICVLGFGYTQEHISSKRITKQQFSISTANKLKQLELKEPNKKVHLYVKGDIETIQNLVKRVGGHYKYQFREMHAILIPAKDVSAFVNYPGIKDFKLNFASGIPLADTMLMHANVMPLHNQEGILSKPFKGKDVVIGIIDTGIDFAHADFKDADGNTRILYIWDQVNGADDIPIYGYGHEWDSAAINGGSCTHNDPSAYYGHGTSVAALAAGNGLSTGKYPGVAPEADIIAVASDFNDPNWTQTVAEAIEYIFTKADELGKPCVINTSLGTYYGSHDGLDVAAQMIDDLIKAKPGRAVVASAGNAGSGAVADFHLSYDVSENDTNFTWFKYNTNSTYLGYGAVFFELWADTADLNYLEFAVGADKVSPNYSFRGRTSFDNIQNRLNAIVSEDITNGGNVIGTVDTWAEIIGGQYFLQVHMYEPDSSQYNFRFITTGTGKFDVWSAKPLLSFSDMVKDDLPDETDFPDIARYQLPDSTQSIVSSWTCLPSVITVGNYMNRKEYIDYNGTVRNLGATPVGEWFPTSSIGPNRLGNMKPNIIAPGNKAMTATPMYLVPTTLGARPDVMDQDGVHRTSPGGTSSASPVVAGAVALLFEKCPTLTHDEVMGLIQNSAKADNQTGVVPNILYGYGKIDAFEAFKLKNISATLTTSGLLDTCSAFELSTSANYDLYNWSTGSANDTISIADSASYYAFVKNSSECYDFTDSLLVDFVSIGNFSVAYNDTVFCIGETAMISVTSGYNYLWNNGATISSLSTTNTEDFYATITDAAGCKALSDSISVRFSNYLLGDFKIAYEDTIACVGDPVRLSIASGYFYNWSDLSSDSVLNAFEDTTYFATVINAAGCIGYTDTVRTYYDPYLLGDFTITTGDIVCSNDSAILVLPPGYSVYSWSDGQGEDTIYIKEDGEYFATLKNAAGCTGFSDTVEVNFYISPPIPSINNINDTLLEAPLSASYQWYLDDVALVNDTLQELKPNNDGEYSVEVFHANGCSEFSNPMYIDYINGINDNQMNTIRVYPNPSNGQFTVDNLDEIKSVSLIDVTGRLLRRVTDIKNRIIFSDLATGVYFVEIISIEHEMDRVQVIVE